jgi:hypothetical protein
MNDCSFHDFVLGMVPFRVKTLAWTHGRVNECLNTRLRTGSPLVSYRTTMQDVVDFDCFDQRHLRRGAKGMWLHRAAPHLPTTCALLFQPRTYHTYPILVTQIAN